MVGEAREGEMIRVILIAMLISVPAWGEEVLYCTETDANGFYWDKGATEGKRTGFKPGRFIVKIISGTKRTIMQTTGGPNLSMSYTCSRPWSDKIIVCAHGFGNQPWIFHNNTFVHAFLPGPPAGGGDPNIYVAYGTCVKY